MDNQLTKWMARFPVWMNLDDLEKVSGMPKKKISKTLQKLKKKDLVLQSKENKDLWKVEGQKLNREAVEEGFSPQFFCWSILMAERYEASESFEVAQLFFAGAEVFTEEPFRKSYLFGLLARNYVSQGNYEEAIQATDKALRFAEEVPWEPFLQDFNLFMAKLYGHLGLYRESAPYYRKAIEIFKKSGVKDWVRYHQEMGTTLLEQARYSEALKVFQECEEVFFQQGTSFDQALVAISLAQAFNGLGDKKAALEKMEKAKMLLGEERLNYLSPYLKLLEGKFDFIEGKIVSALRVLEEAAHGFEKSGDVSGKVEVLLGMSAPLLEHNLVKEAQDVINLLADWTDLSKYPALEHSVHLRRLALGAFSGRWFEEDIAMVTQDSLKQGRTEDWMQLWFHLALAAQKFNQGELFKVFINQAMKIAGSIQGQLAPDQKDSFLRRPDVARIYRLSEPIPSGDDAQVQAKRDKGGEEAIGPATLAPPISKKEN